MVLAGCSKRPDFSPAQPWRAETRLVPSKAAASCHIIRGGWDDPNCAQHSTHPALSAPRRALSRARAFQFPIPLFREWPRLPSTARIERVQFHRARSASKEGTWPLPPYPSEAARCASTGIVPATPSPLFQHPAM
jgi:hypothetical protein